jgi:glycosyltransferase involved in cell wall biosynthesis
LKIAILGTRGVPNNYGGFEQFAEILSTELSSRGLDVVVYNPHFHPYRKDTFGNVKIVRKYSPENLIGSAANFIYDWLCLKDAQKRRIDIALELGYQSAAISYLLVQKGKMKIITNMDGLEWKRAKWNSFVKYLTRKFEKLAVKRSDELVADNIGIAEYLREEYGAKCHYIAYPADLVEKFDPGTPSEFELKTQKYYLVISRLEPENNLEMILDGFIESGSDLPLLIIGNHQTKYGSFLKNKYVENNNIIFYGGLYNKQKLDDLRHFCRMYFHGHSVGGTNPSLLEAMAAQSFIVAHDNAFNRSVLGNEHEYFHSLNELSNIIRYNDSLVLKKKESLVEFNKSQIQKEYSVQKIVNAYYELLINN